MTTSSRSISDDVARRPQPVDVLVDRGVLLDVRVARRDVRLGLVVVVVRDEVLDGVVREEALELPVELRRQRLVVRQHERRPPVVGDDVRHRHRLPRARDAEQRLEAVAADEAGGQLSMARGWSPAGAKGAWRSNGARSGMGAI
jgi:hypothetical protein